MPETKIIHLKPEGSWRAAIAEAAEIIRTGGLVAFPTETVYGLGADALSSDAARKIFSAKGRPASDPLIVHLHTPADLSIVADQIPVAAERLAEAFWPGPLTLVLQRSGQVPDLVSAGLSTVAVRVPAHPVAQALLEESERPIAAPSANRFAHTSPTTGAHVLADLEGRIDLLLDAGPTEVGVESTVLDLTTGTPTILRPGGITWEALQGVLGEVIVAGGATEQTETPDRGARSMKSPGLLERHYAPEIPLILYSGEATAARAAMQAATTQHLNEGKRVGLLLFAEDRHLFQESDVVTRVIGSEADPAATARALYAALRAMETQALDLILVRTPGTSGMGLAVRDRLMRAADQVVHL